MSQTTRGKLIALIALALTAAFLIGFLPQWATTRALDRQVAVLEHQLDLARLQNVLGAALAEAQRTNYERARQLMSGFFSGLEVTKEGTEGPRRRELEGILEERDEVITLLSRASPESTMRLNQLFTRYHRAVGPEQPGPREERPEPSSP